MAEPEEVRATVRALVDTAGLPMNTEEFEKLVAAYPAVRTAADSLYMEEVRYEEPALVFAPVPPDGRTRAVQAHEGISR